MLAESLRPHYVRTIDCWIANLKRNEAAAWEIVGEQVYRTYLKYLSSCRAFFQTGECTVYQFTLRPLRTAASPG
jgi:cyclopropane-fatty-acyl-phospholipid synthase